MTQSKDLVVFVASSTPGIMEILVKRITDLERVRLIGKSSEILDTTSKIFEHLPDIVFLEVSLEGGSGIEILKKIRGKSIPSIVVLFELGAGNSMEKMCRDSGADYFFASFSEFDKIANLIAGAVQN